jgi:hypothetical protein
MFLRTANLSGFEAILASYMRPFFAILGLLLALSQYKRTNCR